MAHDPGKRIRAVTGANERLRTTASLFQDSKGSLRLLSATPISNAFALDIQIPATRFPSAVPACGYAFNRSHSRYSACLAARSRIVPRSPESCSFSAATGRPRSAMPTYTSPTGLPSDSDGPATPVTDTA